MAGFTDFFKFVIRCSLARFRRHETWNSTRIRRQAAEPPMPSASSGENICSDFLGGISNKGLSGFCRYRCRPTYCRPVLRSGQVHSAVGPLTTQMRHSFGL
jgi:hypothetical protein